MTYNVLTFYLFLPLFITEAALTWTTVRDKAALCNDFSRPGYFIEKTNSSSKWLVFLESGGLCYSPETCNRRFLNSKVRKEFATSQETLLDNFYPQFNLTVAWTATKNRNLSVRLNPYMTSMSTFIKDNEVLKNIVGRDIVDSKKENNPSFYDYNHVIIPYCSSDMWLGNDTREVPNINESGNPQSDFLDKVYKPESPTLQFTFRGSVIFRSIINELMVNGLSDATDLILAGSSAGGLGVVNNAKWVYEKLNNITDISIIADSSWFVNFRNNIYRRFNGTVKDEDDTMNIPTNIKSTKDLLTIISTSPQCSDTTQGSPCCLSIYCVLSSPDYFPRGEIPIITLFSLYDVYLLADSIANSVIPGQYQGDSIQPSLGLEFLFIVAEYGGVMNSSIAISKTVPLLSFIVTECLQHIYFATSSLFDSDGILSGISNEEITQDIGNLRGSFM